ncbi:hypothetical protein IEQ34_015165 [Dendrobium chrysotoxum]|uniref:Uncharacterized protein n=1 Tax=Dendrobium chrysotoxum TaxID=161865 RepID=A0AAV7GNH3_DENCH|nr:hypothetical protein IEQ34_015165 [Dendrobium chrysotoxum]
MSTPGRSDFPVGLVGVGISNLSLRTDRSVARFTGESFGSWSRSHENANQSSQTTDIPHSQIASGFLCLILQARNRTNTTMRMKISSLHL